MGKVQLTGGRAISTSFQISGNGIHHPSYSGNANFTPSSADLTETF